MSSIFKYVVELSFLVSKSAHLSPNSRRFRFYRHLKVGRRSEKWPKNRTKIQCFDQDFEKKTFKSLLLIHRLTVLAENLHKGTSQECKKFDGSGILNFSFFRYL